MHIRKLNKEEDDLKALGELYARSWKVAYKGIMPQDYLDSLTSDRWAAFLGLDRFTIYVIFDEGEYKGAISYSAARDKGFDGWAEIVSVYLQPEYYGTGIAEPLFRSAEQALMQEGYRDVYLWVLEKNARAQRFYEKQGLSPNGDSIDTIFGDTRLKEIRFVKHLG